MNSIVEHKSIWIYITNLKSRNKIKIAASLLNVESAIINWSVDTDDIDNVLRVESIGLKESYIPSILAKYNLECIPMPD